MTLQLWAIVVLSAMLVGTITGGLLRLHIVGFFLALVAGLIATLSFLIFQKAALSEIVFSGTVWLWVVSLTYIATLIFNGPDE